LQSHWENQGTFEQTDERSIPAGCYATLPLKQCAAWQTEKNCSLLHFRPTTSEAN
jgi:hypothetical protein